MIELVILCRCIWSNDISLFTYRDAGQRRRASDLTEASKQESKQSATRKGSEASKSITKSLSKRGKTTSSFSSSSSSSSCSSISSSRYYDPIGKQKVSSSWIQTPLFRETSQNLNKSPLTVCYFPIFSTSPMFWPWLLSSHLFISSVILLQLVLHIFSSSPSHILFHPCFLHLYPHRIYQLLSNFHESQYIFKKHSSLQVSWTGRLTCTRICLG